VLSHCQYNAGARRGRRTLHSRLASECLQTTQVLPRLTPVGRYSSSSVVSLYSQYITDIHSYVNADNIIREGLKQRILSLAQALPDSPQQYYLPEGEDQKPVGMTQLRHEQAGRLHAVSSAKCHQVVLRVVRIIRQHFASHGKF
jgi:hypothetical protein